LLGGSQPGGREKQQEHNARYADPETHGR
jgi:hypothetical protein